MGKFSKKFKFEHVFCSQAVGQTRGLGTRRSQLERTFRHLLFQNHVLFEDFYEKRKFIQILRDYLVLLNPRKKGLNQNKSFHIIFRVCGLCSRKFDYSVCGKGLDWSIAPSKIEVTKSSRHAEID